MTTSEEGAAPAAALAKFMNLVAKDPTARKEFHQDPDGTLRKHDVKLTSELEFLKQFSEDELATLAKANDALISAGVSGQYGGITLAHL
jgi:hypothetical protein